MGYLDMAVPIPKPRTVNRDLGRGDSIRRIFDRCFCSFAVLLKALLGRLESQMVIVIMITIIRIAVVEITTAMIVKKTNDCRHKNSTTRYY